MNNFIPPTPLNEGGTSPQILTKGVSYSQTPPLTRGDKGGIHSHRAREGEYQLLR